MNTNEVKALDTDTLRIVKGNSKLGRIPNVSLLPVTACGENAKHCAAQCYAVKFRKIYPTVDECWSHNTAVVRRCIQTNQWDTLEAGVIDYLWSYPSEFFRIHVSGDLFHPGYFDAWKRIAECVPDTTFLAYTKIDDEWILSPRPRNFTLRLSRWPGFTPRASVAAALPSFWVLPDPEAPAEALYCPEDCSTCVTCWDAGNPDISITLHR